jgi:pimeloyl-ACP methyl ester carboxylesterase
MRRKVAIKVMLPGVGHSAAEERPEQVNELLLEFFGRQIQQ